MKIGFFVMTQKGHNVLEELVINKRAQYVDFVCIGKDVKIDDDFSDKIKIICKNHAIEYFYRESLSTKKLNSNYYIAISWRWLIDLPNLIIIHDSILPKYRGFSPLVNMLINGESTIGATALFATNEYDKGDIIAQEVTNIEYPIVIAEAISVVGILYIKIVNTILDTVLSGFIRTIPQNEDEATYSVWLDQEDYFIDWNWSARKIKRKIDACGSPYNGAKSLLESQIIIIEAAEVEQDVEIINRNVGKVIFIKDMYPVVICGEGLLMIKSAIDQNSKESILPLGKFRMKFK